MRGLLPAALVLGAACGDLSVGESTNLDVQASVDFGDVPTGMLLTRELSLRWQGRRGVVVRASPPSDPSFEVVLLERLEPGERFSVPVSFRASAPGLHRASIDLVAGPETRRVALRASALREPLAPLPGVLDFGSVPPGATATLMLPVESLVDVELPVFAGTVENDRGAFGASGITLGPRATGAIPVRFGPPCGRTYAGELTVSCAGCPRSVVQLAGGTPGWLRLDPPVLDLGLVPPRASVTERVAVTNLACISHRVALAIEPAGVEFSTSGHTRHLQPGERQVVEVWMLDAPGGVHTAQLVACGDGLEVRSDLRAVVGGPRLLADPPGLDLGSFLETDTAEASFEVTGAEPGSLRVASVFGHGLEVEMDRPLPAELGEGPLRVTVRPLAGPPGDFASTVEIVATDMRQPRLSVPVSGRRIEGGPCDVEVPALHSVGLRDCYSSAGGSSPSIRNVGSEACTMWNARIEQDASFFVAVDPTPHVISPGTTWRFPLSTRGSDLCHDERVWHGTLLLDHARGVVRIPLVGETAQRSTGISEPTPFGSVGRDDPVRMFVSSHEDLVVEGVEIASPGLFLTRPPRHAVSVNYPLDLPLSFRPEVVGEEEGMLALHVAGHQEPYIVPVWARATGPCPSCRLRASCPSETGGDPGARIHLRGAAGAAAGSALSCTWTMAAEPASGAAELSAAGPCDAVLRASLAGSYRARLEVRSQDEEASCETQISIVPDRIGTLHLEAGWSMLDEDVNLHVFGDGIRAAPAPESWFGDECWPGHCQYVGWEDSSARLLRHDDPELPYEEVALEASAPTSWVVGVHRALATTDDPLDVTLRWICGDAAGTEVLTLAGGGEAAMVLVEWDGAACSIAELPERYELARP